MLILRALGRVLRDDSHVYRLCMRNVLFVQGEFTASAVVDDAVLSVATHGQYDLRNVVASLLEPDPICQD